jgi:RsiW-degrading membrane proteinase PrsW (M82 family)
VRVAVWLALVLCACDPVLGTNDVELVYDVDGDPQPVVDLARRRLAASEVIADIRSDGERVVVRVDRHRAHTAQIMIAWRGEVVVRPASGPPIEFLPAHHAAHADGKVLVIELPANAAATLAALGDPEVEVGLGKARAIGRGALHDVLRQGALRIGLGTDLRAYQRAARAVHLLDAPRLPAMELRQQRDVPTDWALALGATVLPIATGLLWIVFVRRFDRARPEPWWLVLATFALGAAAQLAVGNLEIALWRVSAFLDPRAVSLDRSLHALPGAYAVCLVTVGLLEEGAKLAAVVVLARRRREFDEPVDGIVYACAAAVGFAAAENISYFDIFRLADGIAIGRTLHSMPSHMLLSAIWGYALGQGLLFRARLIACFVLAAALHAAADTSLEFAIPHGADLVLCTLTVLFAVLMRRALRWGVAADHAGATAARAAFGVGRAGPFVIAVFAMFAFGLALIGVGDLGIDSGQRITATILGWATVYGLLFVAACYAATRVLPLDVVVDEAGVSFAGALHRWRAITGVRRLHPWSLVLDIGDREVALGPAAPAVIDRLDAAIARARN